MYLLFDIGGTRLRVGVSRDLRRVERFEVVPTPRTFEAGIVRIGKIAQALVQRYFPVSSQAERSTRSARSKNINGRVEAVCGATPGHVDRKTGKLICSPNLAWGGQPVTATLKKIFRAPVFIENDAALAGLAEATIGAGRGFPIVMYYTVSTGIGGARIVNGAIDAASVGFEPGHQIINVEAKTADRCADRHVPGHLEAFASGAALLRRYGKPAEQLHAKRVWDETARLLATGIANSIVHWSPEIVVLGGGLMDSIQLDKLRTCVHRNLSRAYGAVPRLVRAKLGDTAGLEGARILLRQQSKNF